MNSKINVLYYCEPFPLRNSFTEHLMVARMLLPALINCVRRNQIELRVFSNDPTIDALVNEIPKASLFLQRPTNVETQKLQSQYARWTEDKISEWLDLVNGIGEITQFYTDILERLHRENPIDVILCWSENGAVKKFCETHNICVLHGEMGPTRSPFTHTVYFDPNGTNGNAAFRDIIRGQLERDGSSVDNIPAPYWTVASEKKNETPEKNGSILDIGTTFDENLHEFLPGRRYIYAPLQLADDLNTLLHSKYRDPKEFLADVAVSAETFGYDLVVKGHPGAKSRAYNNRRQVEALLWLEENFPGAKIVPDNPPSNLGNYLLSNAAYTASINSSVSFESMMKGVPGLCFGDAVYDAAGWMQKHIPLVSNDENRDFQEKIDRLVAAHMKHVFYPKDALLKGHLLPDTLIDLVDQRQVDPFRVDFTRTHLNPDSVDDFVESAEGLPPFVGNCIPPAGSVVKIRDNRLQAFSSNGTPIAACQVEDVCTGHIERIKSTGDNKCRVVGWVMDRRSLTAPVLVLLVNEETLVSTHRVCVGRTDVQLHFGLSSSAMCGFEFAITEEHCRNAQLYFITSDGKAHPVSALRGGIAISAQNLKRPETCSAIQTTQKAEGQSELQDP